MNKWNIFEKLRFSSNQKNEEKNQNNIENNSEELKIEYSETLNTGKQTKMSSPSEMYDNVLPTNQRIWRDLNSIEENIDELNKDENYDISKDINGKVDRLFSRKKIK